MKNKRIYSLDCMRVVAFFCIIIYHFFVHLNINGSYAPRDYYIITGSTNMHMATMAVGVFFMLSGFGLMLSTKDKFDLKGYYYSRVTKILLPFWITYAYVFVCRAVACKGWPLGFVSKKTFIFTLFGMDEWISMLGMPTTTLGIGEWFLGNLMVLYLIFPLLRCALLKHPKITCFIAFVVYAGLSVNYYLMYTIEVHMNPILKGFEFFLGMCLALTYERINKKIGYVCLAGIIFCRVSTIDIIIPMGFKITIVSLMVFLLFLSLSDVFEKHKKVNGVVKFIAGYTYDIYLVHHVIIVMNADKYMGIYLETYQVMFIALIDAVEILIAVIALRLVTKQITGSIEKALAK
ncbi:MAG: acyltransferase [Pseudobutyrivibrio sp.]|nr:acyltransferase [Pseudobutyrivibrio sp.]